MDQPNVLRETKMGQKGFVKEDVLMYIDELNSQNEELKKELEKSSGSAADPQEIIKYRNQIDNLQEKLNASNNALRQAKKENEDLQQQISKLKAGGAAPAAGGANIDAQTKAALEAARKEIDSLRAQLKAANEKTAAAPAQAGNNAALDAAKKEIDTLKAQLKAAAEKAEKPAAVDNKSAEELAKANEQITKITAELKSKTDELDSVKRTVSEKDSKIDELTKAKDEAVKKGEEAAKKDEEIAKLNAEIADLKANSNDPAAIMGSLFAEAQRTVSQLKLQAEQEANRTTKDADDKAAAVVREANMTAEKTIREANMAAEKAIAEANMKAKMTVEDANSKAGKINEMSSTVRSMLLNEIESVNSKFNDITTSLMKLTGQATDRMGDAKMIIEEAKKAVAPSDENSVKLAEAPKATFSAAKAPTAEMNKDDSKPADNSDPFSRVAGGSYNSRNSSNNYNNNNNFNNNKPSAPDAQKQAPKKPVSNFNFDMSDLLKAAEEEAAKEEV
ncbi:MAG: hypothetical protein IJN43_10615 [Ruminococcus sp.]|nr:hypothetical protein [Ruminococcus sp.]